MIIQKQFLKSKLSFNYLENDIENNFKNDFSMFQVKLDIFFFILQVLIYIYGFLLNYLQFKHLSFLILNLFALIVNIPLFIFLLQRNPFKVLGNF